MSSGHKPCPACFKKDAVIEAMKRLNKALRIALENSKRSLAAEGQSVKKAEKALHEAEQALEGTK